MKTKILLLGMTLFLLTFSSCNKDDDGNSSALTSEEANVNAKIDVISDDISNIVDNQLAAEYDARGKSNQVAESYISACPTVTRVPAFGTTITPGTLITKTIDYGADGCALPNGNVLKGKIIITFTYEPDATSHTINYSFDNFYHNDIKINGDKTFTRTMTTETISSPSHPIVTMNMDMTVTFPNGNIYHRVGSRVREIIAGYGTPEWIDNVYQVTGSWTTTLPGGGIQTSEITTPLIIRLNCIHIIVSGVITITRGDVTAVLDYGDGDCDNIAVVTINGVPHTIILGH